MGESEKGSGRRGRRAGATTRARSTSRGRYHRDPVRRRPAAGVDERVHKPGRAERDRVRCEERGHRGEGVQLGISENTGDLPKSTKFGLAFLI